MKHHINDMKRRALHNADAAYYVLSGVPDKTYSRGVMSTRISFHSSIGMSERRRSISATPVDTIWMTAECPASRSASMEAISVGVFIEVRRLAEEALLGGLEGRTRGGLGLAVQRAAGACRAGRASDVGGLHRGGEVVVDDGESPSIGIIDGTLLRGKRMLDQFIFDAVVRQRPRGVEAEGAEISGQHFYGRDSARLDGLDELGAGHEWEVFAAPRAEPLRIGKVVNRGRPGS